MPEPRLLRVVQVGQTVGQAGSEMQQRRSRLVGDPVIAVGGAGDDALEQAEHAAHAVDLVERGDEMHFRCAGVRKAGIDPIGEQRADQAFGTVDGTGISSH